MALTVKGDDCVRHDSIGSQPSTQQNVTGRLRPCGSAAAAVGGVHAKEGMVIPGIIQDCAQKRGATRAAWPATSSCLTVEARHLMDGAGLRHGLTSPMRRVDIPGVASLCGHRE